MLTYNVKMDQKLSSFYFPLHLRRSLHLEKWISVLWISKLFTVLLPAGTMSDMHLQTFQYFSLFYRTFLSSYWYIFYMCIHIFKLAANILCGCVWVSMSIYKRKNIFNKIVHYFENWNLFYEIIFNHIFNYWNISISDLSFGLWIMISKVNKIILWGIKIVFPGFKLKS